MDFSLSRPGPGMKPYVVREVDELRKTVSALQVQMQEQKLDNELLKSSITGLQKTALALEDRTSALEERADSEEQEDPDKEQPKSPEDVEASVPKATPSVAVIRRVLADGGWVILHGQCWRYGKKEEGERKHVMVSDKEMEASGVYWRDIRGMTDRELLERHSITRGGVRITMEGRPKQTLVPEHEVRKANRVFLATLTDESDEGDSESDEGDSESDEGDSESDKGTSSGEANDASASDAAEEGAESQDEAALDRSSDKEPDLRRRSRRLTKTAKREAVKVGAIDDWNCQCSTGHALKRCKSHGSTTCNTCTVVVPRDEKFLRCRICHWSQCFECNDRAAAR